MIPLKENFLLQEIQNKNDFDRLAIPKHYSPIYEGRIEDIPNDVAIECVDRKYGETEINDEPIYTYKDYTGTSSKLYPKKIHHPISKRDLDEIWRLNGCLRTSYFHINAKTSITAACKTTFCRIIKYIKQ